MEGIKQTTATPKCLRKIQASSVIYVYFGEMGFVLTHRQIGYKSKISDKGKEVFFVGYAIEHAGDVYRMYDPNMKRIKISHDLRWMGKFYNDGHPIKIPEYKENNSTNMKSIPPPIRYDDAQKESNLRRLPLNEENILENLTTNDVAEVMKATKVQNNLMTHGTTKSQTMA